MTTSQRNPARATFAALAVGTALVLAACTGTDDGADVRTVGGTDAASGPSGGSASGPSGGSASGPSGGSASGPSGGASGSLANVACEPVGDLSEADTVVPTVLDEWSIEPETQEVAAGMIGFDASNAGEEPHEIVVVQAASAEELPVDDQGAFDESAVDPASVIGEIEAFPAGEDCSGVFDLEPAEYVLVCNIVETEPSGEIEAHFAKGMYTEFTVTE